MASTTTSPFFSKSGVDRYERSSPLYYFLQITLWIYILGYVAYLALVLNTSVIHSYTATIPAGTLVSDRYSTLRWFVLALGPLRIFVPLAVLWLILYRRTLGCSIVWLIVLFLLLAADIVALSGLGIDYANCNGQNQAGNLCNDPLWCCVPEIFGNSNNGCLNVVPCNPPVALGDLSSSVDFRWLFFVTLAFVVLDLLLFLIPLALWFAQPVGPVEEMGEVEDAGQPLSEFVKRKPKEKPQRRRFVHVTPKTKY